MLALASRSLEQRTIARTPIVCCAQSEEKQRADLLRDSPSLRVDSIVSHVFVEASQINETLG